MNIVITGTAQGIGLELTKLALADRNNVLAIARSKENSAELEALAKGNSSLRILYADLSKEGSIEAVTKAASELGHVDLLVNNAGVYRKGETRSDFEESFLVNTITPFLLTKSLLPLLKKSKAPKAAHLSSMMGSIEDNTSGGSHAYRSSKTALNMIMKGFTVEESWLASLCLHPGWVQTRMGTDAAPVKPTDSAKGLWKVMSDFTLSQSGSFVDFQGRKLPW